MINSALVEEFVATAADKRPFVEKNKMELKRVYGGMVRIIWVFELLPAYASGVMARIYGQHGGGSKVLQSETLGGFATQVELRGTRIN
ncbi:hypothetical protein BaRGS_00006807 [Batillaria attramentaria]|uniref:Uncharacterized protein n=1 Tax=Batillaria attramentaria TaxID=370345 RepID=A0ABD0LR65_9CAEN